MISNEERISLYKSKYESELSRRDTLTDQLTLPLAMVGLIFGVLNYCIAKIGTLDGFFKPLSLKVLLILLIIDLGILVYFIIKSNYNYLYSYTPNSDEIEKYYQKLKEYYSEPETVKKEFENFLIKSYCVADKKNTENNDLRSGAFHNARRTFIIGLLISVFAVGICNANTIQCFFNITEGGNSNGVIQSTTTATPTTPTTITTP